MEKKIRSGHAPNLFRFASPVSLAWPWAFKRSMPCRRLINPGLMALLGLLAICHISCSRGNNAPATSAADNPNDGLPPEIHSLSVAINDPANPLPVYTCSIVNTFPHNRTAFTEGLFFLNGFLYESTGLNGQSSLRRTDLATGNVLQRFDLDPKYFGEGLAPFNGKLYQLTWQSHIGFIYDLDTFQLITNFTFPYEGWGLTTDGRSLIESDGTDQIHYFDPATFTETRHLTVTARGHPVTHLNELEYIKGELYANVWGSDYIVRIDPATGNILGVIDCSGLLDPSDRDAHTDVLNGIAYDPATDRLFITGKCWPKLFEIKIKPLKP